MIVSSHSLSIAVNSLQTLILRSIPLPRSLEGFWWKHRQVHSCQSYSWPTNHRSICENSPRELVFPYFHESGVLWLQGRWVSGWSIEYPLRPCSPAWNVLYARRKTFGGKLGSFYQTSSGFGFGFGLLQQRKGCLKKSAECSILAPQGLCRLWGGEWRQGRG